MLAANPSASVAVEIALDEQCPAWGNSRYVDLRLTGPLRLADALNHLAEDASILDARPPAILTVCP